MEEWHEMVSKQTVGQGILSLKSSDSQEAELKKCCGLAPVESREREQPNLVNPNFSTSLLF
jgi:hypothetical protein